MINTEFSYQNLIKIINYLANEFKNLLVLELNIENNNLTSIRKYQKDTG
jgi:hypothetical protein